MSNYPSPCDTCKEAKTCVKGFGCNAWRTRYRYRQKQINAYAQKKKEAYFATRFVYQNPNDTRKFLQKRPCEGCEQETECDIPCSAYLAWYDARMMIVRKAVEQGSGKK